MSSTSENIMVDTKIINLLQLYQKMALFDFGKVVAILDVTHNAKPKVFFGHTTMSGIPENLKVDAEIINLLQLCRM